MLKIGDVFEISLSDGRRAYGQYVFKGKKIGPLIQIFNMITKERVDINLLKGVKPLFPPVSTGVFAATRTGLWTIIGRIAIEKFECPNFISALYDEKTGEVHMWYLQNDEKDTKVGRELPDEYKNLEYSVVWSPYDVIDRIETGKYPYPYKDLIKHNRFIPLKKPATKNESTQ